MERQRANPNTTTTTAEINLRYIYSQPSAAERNPKSSAQTLDKTSALTSACRGGYENEFLHKRNCARKGLHLHNCIQSSNANQKRPSSISHLSCCRLSPTI